MKPITEEFPVEEWIPDELFWLEDAPELDDWFWLLLLELDFPFEYAEVDLLFDGRS